MCVCVVVGAWLVGLVGGWCVCGCVFDVCLMLVGWVGFGWLVCWCLV